MLVVKNYENAAKQNIKIMYKERMCVGNGKQRALGVSVWKLICEPMTLKLFASYEGYDGFGSTANIIITQSIRVL